MVRASEASKVGGRKHFFLGFGHHANFDLTRPFCACTHGLLNLKFVPGRKIGLILLKNTKFGKGRGITHLLKHILSSKWVAQPFRPILGHQYKKFIQKVDKSLMAIHTDHVIEKTQNMSSTGCPRSLAMTRT